MLETNARHIRWQQRRIALLFILILFAQLLSAATQLSATIDEGFHITSGYEYLRTGRMQLFDEHPPLAKALFAWPLFLIPDLPPPETASGYPQGDLIAVAQATVLAYHPIDRVIVACRIPVALLCVLLAASVYRWAAKYASITGGLIALGLFTFDPNILAHGSLATTDLGATAFIFWTLYAVDAYLRTPNRLHWWMVALLLGLAQLTKLTAIILFPIGGILMLTSVWRRPSSDRPRALVRIILAYTGMVAIAALIVWIGYGFEVHPVPDIADGVLPIPAASHIERWLRLRANLTYGRESFLLGQNRMHGWWQYFPIAFTLKTPLPILILTVWSLWFLVYKARNPKLVASKTNPYKIQNPTLWLFPILYAASTLFSTINIGYRHLLPILPFLYVGIGRIRNHKLRILNYESRTEPPTTGFQLPASSFQHHVFPLLHCGNFARFTFCVSIIWLAIGTLSVSPYYLTFFNELAGGPNNGWRFLADSNTDWGQTLKALADYQQEHTTGPVKLSLFTFLNPATYSVEYKPIAPMPDTPPVLPRRFNPEPGLYAISATTLDGVPLPYPATYNWFRHREPEAQIARVMHLYRVPPIEDHTWIAQCSRPVVPLDAATIDEGFDIPNIRVITFDCEQSWIVPPGNGWYIRATSDIDRLRWPRATEHLERWPDWTQQLPLTRLHISYVQSQSGELPPFTIWEWTADNVVPSRPVSPDPLDDTLAFLGYDAPTTAKPGETVNVITYWRILTPPTRPLSLMLHLIDTNGSTVAIGDGLGIPVDQWQSNDIIVQRHTFNIPATTNQGPHALLSGAYWLDTMQRLSTKTGDILHIASIQIKP